MHKYNLYSVICVSVFRADPWVLENQLGCSLRKTVSLTLSIP